MTQDTPMTATLLPLRRLEGAAIAAAGALVFAQVSGNLWLFAALVLVPDVAMIGYLGGARLGAMLYNAAHTYLVPVLLGLAAVVYDQPTLLALSAVWVFHIGADRALGYGLKRASGFNDTHLTA